MRPSWDTVWLRMAHIIAERSRCVRSAVGCVIADSSNAVVSVGYNGPPANHYESNLQPGSKCDHWCQRAKTGGSAAFYDDCVSSHAEMNALVRGFDFTGCTMYVTRVPCFTCSKVIANSGVIRVVFPIAPEDREREPERSIRMLHDCGIDVVIF